MTDPAAVQTVWAARLVATLADAGVRTCVVSPGSRSTPLVAALAAEPRIAAPVVIDERAAAFCALGAARATGEVVALVCTSGTAGAHWLPALIEAAEAGVPLVAITADRPPELQGAGAPQTIDQVRLFGGFVRSYVDLGPADGSELALRALRRKVAQAVVTARGPRPGPVHLEAPFRKPLEPLGSTTQASRALADAPRHPEQAPAEGRRASPPPFFVAHRPARSPPRPRSPRSPPRSPPPSARWSSPARCRSIPPRAMPCSRSRRAPAPSCSPRPAASSGSPRTRPGSSPSTRSIRSSRRAPPRSRPT